MSAYAVQLTRAATKDLDQLLPPLVLTDAECDEIVSIVRKVFS